MEPRTPEDFTALLLAAARARRTWGRGGPKLQRHSPHCGADPERREQRARERAALKAKKNRRKASRR